MNRILAVGLAAGFALTTVVAAVAQEKPSTKAFNKDMEDMMPHMHMQMSGDTDKDFASLMSAHLQGAIDIAKAEIEYGKDPQLRELAQRIVDTQGKDVKLLLEWLILAEADHHH